ncbi:hypothetical protein TrispH2_004920 [Trichoplax sp. H2]|nr:hypothetical protein TrispH2_004920 [Trichoplax sp. H2]|eukprot:RDD42948.1 hypothetical protein TrispH2_004920 [Trichoplax sp. H2]
MGSCITLLCQCGPKKRGRNRYMEFAPRNRWKYADDELLERMQNEDIDWYHRETSLVNENAQTPYANIPNEDLDVSVSGLLDDNSDSKNNLATESMDFVLHTNENGNRDSRDDLPSENYAKDDEVKI